MTLTLLQYNTHLFTGTVAAKGNHTVYDDERRRAGIIAAIQQAPPGLVAQYFGQAAIVVGDLNVIGEAGGVPTQEWADVAAGFARCGLIDGFRACHPDIPAAPGFTYDGAENALIRYFAPQDAGATTRLDYIWAPAGLVSGAAVDRSFDYRNPRDGASTPLSDHFALRIGLEAG